MTESDTNPESVFSNNTELVFINIIDKMFNAYRNYNNDEDLDNYEIFLLIKLAIKYKKDDMFKNIIMYDEIKIKHLIYILKYAIINTNSELIEFMYDRIDNNRFINALKEVIDLTDEEIVNKNSEIIEYLYNNLPEDISQEEINSLDENSKKVKYLYNKLEENFIKILIKAIDSLDN